MKFRWLEVFYSLQGEGLRVGHPSIFIRMYGCNFRCEGFGMKPGEKTDEWKKIDVGAAKDLDELPIVKTGCDSYAAWDPRAIHLTKTGDAKALAEEIEFTYASNLGGVDIVMTGGEPLLTWQVAYPRLFDKLYDMGARHITFETNGTQRLHPLLREYFEKKDFDILFSISPKLWGTSGNKVEKAILPKVVDSYVYPLKENKRAVFKFVVSKYSDIREVHTALGMYQSEGINIPVYLMPVGSKKEMYEENRRFVAEACMQNKWNYSPRLQVDLFKNEWGT